VYGTVLHVSMLELCVTPEMGSVAYNDGGFQASQRRCTGMCKRGNATHLVCVPEPCCAFLLTAHQRNPLAAASTKSFPYIEIAFGSASVLWALECSTSSCTDTMRERLVVPKGAVLQN
jgi:hypothetical protein